MQLPGPGMYYSKLQASARRSFFISIISGHLSLPVPYQTPNLTCVAQGGQLSEMISHIRKARGLLTSGRRHQLSSRQTGGEKTPQTMCTVERQLFQSISAHALHKNTKCKTSTQRGPCSTTGYQPSACFHRSGATTGKYCKQDTHILARASVLLQQK